MIKNFFVVLILILSLAYALDGRCVTIQEARAGGIKGTDCELFAMGFCPSDKTTEEQYGICHGSSTPQPAPEPTPEPTPEPEPLPVVYPTLYYNNYEIAAFEYSDVWGFGYNQESDPEMAPIIEEYNKIGGCSGNSPTGDPWSAAFISYVMNKSGIPFPSSCSHIEYFRDVKNEESGPCKTYPMSEKNQIQAGDILCRCRPAGTASSCFINYTDLPTGYVPAHCDIISTRVGDMVWIIGGNVAAPDGDPNAGVTVNERERQLSNLGPDYFGYISCAGMGKPLPSDTGIVEMPDLPPDSPAPSACPLTTLLAFGILFASLQIKFLN